MSGFGIGFVFVIIGIFIGFLLGCIFVSLLAKYLVGKIYPQFDDRKKTYIAASIPAILILLPQLLITRNNSFLSGFSTVSGLTNQLPYALVLFAICFAVSSRFYNKRK